MQIQDQFDPHTWEDYFGHSSITLQAKRLLHNGDIPRSILVSGPTGVGKSSLVRLFIKALRCQNRKPGEFDPCGRCAQCRFDARKAQPDVDDMLWVQSGSSTETLNAQTKQALEFLRTPPVRHAPSHQNYRVLVIDEIDVIPYPQIVSLYYETELPQTGHGKTICFFLTMNEDKIHDQQFRALGDRGLRWSLKRLSVPALVDYLTSRFPSLTSRNATLIAEDCGGSIRSGLEIISRIQLLDEFLSDFAVNEILQASPVALRQELWACLQNPRSAYRDFVQLVEVAEAKCDRLMLIRQLQRDVEEAIEYMPSSEQFQFLTMLVNIRNQSLPLAQVLGLFKGKTLLDPTRLQDKHGGLS